MNITSEQIGVEIEVFIEGQVPSLKNSKIKTSRGIFMSKTCMNYLRSLNIQGFSSSKKTVKGYVSKDKPNLFLEQIKPLIKELAKGSIENPLIFGLHFVRKTKAKFDYNNSSQMIFDLLTAHSLIEDDSMSYVIPFPYKKDGKWFSLSKERPGVYIKII
mgnify:CR=1 FL=1